MRNFFSVSFFSYLILLLTVFFPGCSGVEENPSVIATGGKIDFSGVSFQNRKINLNGEWAYYPEQFLDPAIFLNRKDELPKDSTEAQKHTESPSEIKILPGEWNSYTDENGSTRGSNGYATYTLTMNGLPAGSPLSIFNREMGTSYRVFFCTETMTQQECRTPLLENGKPGKDQDETIPYLLPRQEEFVPPLDHGTLILHIANFHHRQGGPWEVISIGEPSFLTKEREASRAMAYISLGIILIMGLYHLGLYGQRREDKGALFFGLFCLDLTVRMLVTERIFHGMIQEPSELAFEWLYKLEYLTFFAGTAFFGHFFFEVFRDHLHRLYIYFIYGVAALFIAQLIFEVSFYSHTIIGFQLFTLVIALYSIYALTRSFKDRVAGSGISLISFIILFVTVINDILYSRGTIHTAYILPYGFLVFIFSQSLILSVRFSLAYRESEAFRTSMARFVPSQFVQFLGKRSILDVEAGEGLEKKLTVLFLDIKGFTTISESMNPEENFVFLNTFLKRMNPHIHSKGGFVDKFIGDAIMALFPDDGPRAAVEAAITMQYELQLYNQERESQGLAPLGMGIGIHTGNLMIGTVGTIDRLDTTVIGDTVNLAARLESLTRIYHSPILISEATRQELPEDYHIRKIDRVQIKGKRTLVDVYEVYDSEPKDVIAKKDNTRGSLLQALELMKAGQYSDSIEWLDRCLLENPDDETCHILRRQAVQSMRQSTGPTTGPIEPNTRTD